MPFTIVNIYLTGQEGRWVAHLGLAAVVFSAGIALVREAQGLLRWEELALLLPCTKLALHALLPRHGGLLPLDAAVLPLPLGAVGPLLNVEAGLRHHRDDLADLHPCREEWVAPLHPWEGLQAGDSVFLHPQGEVGPHLHREEEDGQDLQATEEIATVVHHLVNRTLRVSVQDLPVPRCWENKPRCLKQACLLSL